MSSDEPSTTPAKRKSNRTQAYDLVRGSDGQVTTKRAGAGEPEAVKAAHGFFLGGMVYGQQVEGLLGEQFGADTAVPHVEDLLKRLKPRDPLEEMLVIQALWTHARLAKLSELAIMQTEIKQVQVVHDACDKAANTYRRHMLALADYRRPSRPGVFMPVSQLNAAGQQVVQNAENSKSEKRNATNEQGSGHEQTKTQAALSAKPEWSGFTAGVGESREAMAVEHGTEDGRG